MEDGVGDDDEGMGVVMRQEQEQILAVLEQMG